jgi:hypothetical protein
MPDCHLTSYPTLVLNLILVQDESTIRTPRSRRFLQSITPYPFDSPLLLLVSTFSCRRSLLNTFPRFIRPQKTMSYSSYSSGAATWQERLEEKCREAQLHPPVFQVFSDRRGGRTAWSSTVTVQGQNISARYWYDGQYVNNAKEDAAEVALKHLNGSTPSSPSQSRTGW